jgi:uncharacterized membrane protein YagU involved in acid resistance
MDTVYLSLTRLLLTAVVAGMFGGLGMICAMRFVARAEWARYDMVVAVGSLVTRSRQNAFRTGLVIHTVSAVVFAFLYTMAMAKLGLAHLPTSIFAGLLFGLIHGMIVSILLVWVVAEQHPLEEFRSAGFAVGLVHFIGHLVYGAIVGLAVGMLAG